MFVCLATSKTFFGKHLTCCFCSNLAGKVDQSRKTAREKSMFVMGGQTYKHAMTRKYQIFARQCGLLVKALAKQANIAWQTFSFCLPGIVCVFGNHDKHCWSMFEKFGKHFMLVTSKKRLSNICLCGGQTDKYCA